MISRRNILTLLGAGGACAGAGLLINNITSRANQSKSIPYIGMNKIPNVPLVAHTGQHIRFYDDLVKDRILVINMMYTSCSGICPLATSNLIHVYRLLTEKMPQNFVMCSLTLNPEIDNPAILSNYVNQYQLPPAWLYLTGDPQHVKLIRMALGFFDIDPEVDNDFASHTGMLRLGNESLGRWSMMPSQANPKQVVDAIMHLARSPLKINT